VTAGAADTMALEGKTLVDVAAKFMSVAQLGYFVVAGALLACATSINVVFTLVARFLLVASNEGLLPRFLSRVDIESGSPVGGLTLAYVLAALALLSEPSLLFFGTLTNFPIIVAVALVSILVITLPHRFPALYQRSVFHPPPLVLWAVCGTVIAANVTIFVFLASASPKATWTYAGMLLVFSLYAISRRKTLATLTKIAPVNDSSTPQIPVI
jgi:APA family basic amino acid/polyamine antiporter